MFSTSITLGVVAGLLAAAGPAGAQLPASAGIGTGANGGTPFFGGLGNDTLDTLHTRGKQVGSEGLKGGASELLSETVTVHAPNPSDARR